ncbi:MAG: tetratricopeptide repeat protein [Planctomycetales bacterium]|nr:tetratricopeptide repeat protein [Planctomycetales bacterium]
MRTGPYETHAELDREGRPHLADFGLAKSVATGSRLTRTGQALGTPAYMSPEQARGEISKLTSAADVWSLGCVLYETLTGRSPFEADSDAAVVGNALLAEPPRLRTLRWDVPAGLERVVTVCLAKRVPDRYRDAATLRDDLDRVQRGERPRARLPGGPRWKAVIPVLLGGAAAVVIVARWPRADSPARVPVDAAPSAVQALAAKARALRQSDPQRAAKILREVLEREPARDALRVERGLLLWAVGQNAEAREEWGRVAPTSTEGPWARLFLGLEALWRLDAKRARPHLVAVPGATGRAGSLARAAVLAMDEDWAGAREALRDVEGWEAHLIRGYVEDRDEAVHPSLAEREYGIALASGIPFAWALNNRGAARRNLGDLAGSMADLDRALDLAPRLVEAWNNRAATRRELGDPAGALADLTRALEVDPRDGKSWSNRGNAKQALGDIAGAVADFDRAVEMSPRLAVAWSNRGNLKRGLGDLAGAVADLDRALELDPRYAGAWSNRGLAKLESGDAAGAAADLDRAIELDPRDPKPWNTRGNARRELRDFAGARADYDRALELHPRYVKAWYNRAVLRQTRGDLAGAVSDYDRALELDPRDADAWNNRGTSKWALGDIAGALPDYQKALEVAPPAWPHRDPVEKNLANALKRLAEGGK